MVTDRAMSAQWRNYMARLRHFAVCVNDLDKAAKFYETVLGMQTIPSYNFGFRTKYLRCGDLQLHIFELEDHVPVYQHFALDVDDFHHRGKAGVLGLTQLGPIARMPRSAALEVAGSDFVRTARAKGLNEPRVFARHVLGAALVPILTVAGIGFGGALGGFTYRWLSPQSPERVEVTGG